ncbi:glycosyltransferase family 2 protein, partial [Bacteroidota bacterium]
MIAILAYTAITFLAIRFLVVISNTLFHFANQDRWRTDKPMVSVLIPARNEETNIPHLMDCLLK